MTDTFNLQSLPPSRLAIFPLPYHHPLPDLIFSLPYYFPNLLPTDLPFQPAWQSGMYLMLTFDLVSPGAL